MTAEPDALLSMALTEREAMRVLGTAQFAADFGDSPSQTKVVVLTQLGLDMADAVRRVSELLGREIDESEFMFITGIERIESVRYIETAQPEEVRPCYPAKKRRARSRFDKMDRWH